MIFNEIFLLLQLYLMQNSYLCTQIYRYCMQNIRNIAIIAHVDHGKTTLVDKMLLAGNLFRSNQSTGELMLDNNDLERERGITILSKNVSITYNGTKINIIDTPGHSDFGGEVERVLNMADGCILLVDAFEGPMPQTRFVLQKALEIGLKPIVVINKVDKPNCRPDEVHEMVFDLMFSLDATEEQLDFPTIYGSAKNGWMSTDWQKPTESITPLLDCIVENIPAPTQLDGTPQMLITSLDYSSYTGRIAVGRVHRGTLKEGMNVSLAKRDGSFVKTKIKEVHVFEGLGRVKTTEVSSGDICALVGIDGFEIGDTICDYENPEARERDLKNPACVIDTNHSNSNKKFEQQIRIAKEVMHSRKLSADIHSLVKGLMIESYIEDGCQKVGEGIYGKSITDPCLGWASTEKLIYEIADKII